MILCCIKKEPILVEHMWLSSRASLKPKEAYLNTILLCMLLCDFLYRAWGLRNIKITFNFDRNIWQLCIKLGGKAVLQICNYFIKKNQLMHMMWEPHANVFNTCLNSKIISALLATFWSYICLFVLLEAFIKKWMIPI